jgi:ferrous iron transport protein B
VFISFYVPCVSTFAVMLKTIGRRDALAVGVDFGRRGAAGGRRCCGLAAAGWNCSAP